MGLMPSGSTPWVKYNKQEVLGQLKGTGSRDTDVLFAQKQQLLAPQKNLKLLGWICIGCGAFFTVTIILAWIGIPFVIFGWWLGRFSKRNIQTVEDAYTEYLGAAATRAIVLLLAFTLASTSLFAQTTAALRTGVVYQCPSGPAFKVLSCTGAQDAASCDVQAFNGGQPAQRAQWRRDQVAALAQMCHAQTAAEASAASRPIAAPPADANGFKVGDTVEINTGFGWMKATILSMNGNSYRVRSQIGVEITKTYPDELHRSSPAPAPAAAGSAAPSSTAPRAAAFGTPPRPGLKSCAGKVEGRYATNGLAGSQTIEFRSGKAIIKDAIGDNDTTLECWTNGEKLYLHKPGDAPSQDMPIDINDDGTLQTPMGELKKKGK